MEDAIGTREISLPLRVLGTLWSALALAVMLTFWQEPYPCVLISPFRAHLLVAMLLVGLPMSLAFPHPRRWVFLGMPLAVSVTFYSYFASPVHKLDPAHCGHIRLVVSNLLSSNQDLSRFRDWVTQEKPDVVALLEVSEEQRSQLESLPFTYKILYPRKGNFGLGMLCQSKPLSVQVLEENSPFPSLLATWPEYRLLVTHPIPPISRGARISGDDQLQRLLSLNDGSSPLLVAGDLNATGWDARLQSLKSSGLQEARLGHGLVPTWPANRPVPGIPIDHIFMPAGWESVTFQRGPDIGSDHYPLVCEMAYPLSDNKGSNAPPAE